jgi:hypothetical protein
MSNSKTTPIPSLNMKTLLPCLLLALWTLPSAAHVCGTQQWTYTVDSLQEARRRVKSETLQTNVERIECAQKILESPNLEPPFEVCQNCAIEFAGLLADSAVFMRRASEEAGSPGNKKAYLAMEVDTRKELNSFLTSETDAAVRARYFDSNLAALADAMERLSWAQEYHDLIRALAASEKLKPKPYEVWARAIRSCSKWDFASGRNRDLTRLRTELCTTECRDSLSEFYQALRSANIVNEDGTIRPGFPPVPSIAECNVPAVVPTVAETPQ